jgi:asparagine synthase (glutamine-hydrolysing)
MSAIGGMYSMDGAPAERETLRELSRALRPMGPDGEEFFAAAGVGMVYRPFHTDAASRGEVQPVSAGDGLVLAFDGRIDNEGELRGLLGLAAEPGLRGPALMLAVFRRWGADGFARVIGDFALALWDGSRKRLVLATDGMGRRPLYYLHTPGRVYWASMCRPLLQAGGIAPEIDDGYVADYLANRVPSGSPFRGIGQVPGGHVLEAGAEGAEVRRYWAPDVNAEIRYRTDREYEEHFAELFREAVACRLKADGPVTCELSGGVDSSTIVCMADRLVREGAAETPGIRTASFVFDHSASSDERRYIRMIEEHLGRAGLHINEETGPLLQPLNPGLVPDTPSNRLLFMARQDHLNREMTAMGSRVVLSGIGGDQLFFSQPSPGQPLADLLVQGRVVEALRTCGAWSHAAGGLPYLKTLWMGGIRPLLPRRLDAALQPAWQMAEWLDPAFVRRTGFRERMLRRGDDVGFRLPSRAEQWGLLRRTMRMFALERWSGEGYLDARYPYLDRRIVQFALSVPLEQAVRPGESRSLVRRGQKGHGPPAVLERRTKSGPGEAMNRALIHEWPRLSQVLKDPRVVAHGFVDGDAFRTALTRARHGMTSNSSQLLKTLSLELWLRTLDTCSHSGSNAPPDERQPFRQGSNHAQADLHLA